jgi:hypothetical protein
MQLKKKKPALTNAGFGEDTVLGGSGKPKLLDVLLYRALRAGFLDHLLLLPQNRGACFVKYNQMSTVTMTIFA